MKPELSESINLFKETYKNLGTRMEGRLFFLCF